MQYETIATASREVHCDGGPSGHPRVYLHIVSEEGEVVCPYCSRVYRLVAAAYGH